MQTPYLTIKSPLDAGSDSRFAVKRLEGTERFNDDFEFKVEVITENRLTEADYIRLQDGSPNVTVCIGFPTDSAEMEYRYINGVVFSIEELWLWDNQWVYSLTLNSWLKSLDFAEDCRIFKAKSSMAVIKLLLGELGISDFKDEAPRGEVHEQIIQYQETLYNFIRRLLKREGLMFHIDHLDGRHVVHFKNAADFGKKAMLPSESQAVADKMIRIRPTRHHVSVDGGKSLSYNWSTAMTSDAETKGRPTKKFRHFVYPGQFANRAAGEAKLNRTMEAHTPDKLVLQGESTRRDFAVGKGIKLKTEVFNELNNQSMLLREVTIKADEKAYHNEYVMQSDTMPCPVPERSLKIPKIHGVHTATVVGVSTPSKVDTDQIGAIRVVYHWDYRAEKLGTSYYSAEIRCAGPSVGNQRGFIFVPNIGDEVAVTHTNGIPEQAVMVGVLYNKQNKQPHIPSVKPTLSVIKPNSATLSNEVQMDDAKDTEKFIFNAKKDMNIKVGNDLEMETEDDMLLVADTLVKTATGNLITGNIFSMTGTTMTHIAAKKITRTSIIANANLAGGAAANLAGGVHINAAIGYIMNGSGGNMKNDSTFIFNATAGDIESNGQKGVKNKSLIVLNAALESMENKSKQTIKNKALLGIVEKSNDDLTKADEVKETSPFVVVKGDKFMNSKD